MEGRFGVEGAGVGAAEGARGDKGHRRGYAVVIDLEDAVAPNRKEAARRNAARVLESRPHKPIFVRVSAPGSELATRDFGAVAGLHLSGLQLPKVESPESVKFVAGTLEELRSETRIQCLIESALGLELAFEIARSHERVARISLGEADLAADLGVRDETGLSRIVSASRAAGLPCPVQSVYTNVKDLDGLRRSTEEGRNMGFVGRSAIHPDEIPTINEVFTPKEEEVSARRSLAWRDREVTS